MRVKPVPNPAATARELRDAAQVLTDAARDIEKHGTQTPVWGGMTERLKQEGERSLYIREALKAVRDVARGLDGMTSTGILAILREMDPETGLRLATLEEIGEAWLSNRTGRPVTRGNMSRELESRNLIDAGERPKYSPSRASLMELAAAEEASQTAAASGGA
jgi:hypothetical protein